jgi:predicted nucleotidyltransferase
VEAPEMGPLRERARRIAQAFSSLPAVEGVCVFGSLARGDIHETSDIDLLVAGSDQELSPTALNRILPEELRNVKQSLAYYTVDELREMVNSAAPFALHLRREALIVYDRGGVLRALLKGDGGDAEINAGREMEARLSQLDVYDDLDMFNGDFLFVLSHLYAIGKSIVILALAVEGRPEFSREAAFARFADGHPELAAEVRTITAIRPFYMLVTRSAHERMPFSRYSAEREVLDVIAAIRRIASVLA